MLIALAEAGEKWNEPTVNNIATLSPYPPKKTTTTTTTMKHLYMFAAHLEGM